MFRLILSTILAVGLIGSASFAEEVCFDQASGRKAEFFVWDNTSPRKVIARAGGVIQTLAGKDPASGLVLWDHLGFLPVRTMSKQLKSDWIWTPALPNAADLVVGFGFQAEALVRDEKGKNPAKPQYELLLSVVGTEVIQLGGCQYNTFIIDIDLTSLAGTSGQHQRLKQWVDPFNMVVFKSESFKTEAHWKMHFADTTTKLVRLR